MLTKHKALCVTSVAVSLFIGGCAGDNCPPAAISDHTVVRTVETMRPCAVAIPARPAPLALPLPTDAVALAATLALKLREWAGPGQYGDTADAALKTCTKP
jgi:hypothetical protein